MAHTLETRAREYKKTRAKRIAYLTANGPCKHCSSSENLQLHHVNPETKISHNIWSWRQDRMDAELAKCIVLCKVCHKKLHNNLMAKHGIGGYRRGCRCEICKGVKSFQNKQRYRNGLAVQAT